MLVRLLDPLLTYFTIVQDCLLTLTQPHLHSLVPVSYTSNLYWLSYLHIHRTVLSYLHKFHGHNTKLPTLYYSSYLHKQSSYLHKFPTTLLQYHAVLTYVNFPWPHIHSTYLLCFPSYLHKQSAIITLITLNSCLITLNRWPTPPPPHDTVTQ